METTFRITFRLFVYLTRASNSRTEDGRKFKPGDVSEKHCYCTVIDTQMTAVSINSFIHSF